MKKTLLGSIALLAIAASNAHAADLAVSAPARWTWSGFYVGGHVGSAMGLNTIANPLGPSIYGDRIHSPGYLGGGQVGVNWQAADSIWVVGLEADASLANLDGTNTCYAVSGVFNSLNCRAHTSAFGTVTGRTGFAFGPNGRALAYVKGGLAWGRGNIDTIVNHNLIGVSGSASADVRAWGWTDRRWRRIRHDLALVGAGRIRLHQSGSIERDGSSTVGHHRSSQCPTRDRHDHGTARHQRLAVDPHLQARRELPVRRGRHAVPRRPAARGGRSGSKVALRSTRRLGPRSGHRAGRSKPARAIGTAPAGSRRTSRPICAARITRPTSSRG